jgi:hypothetical protein
MKPNPVATMESLFWHDETPSNILPRVLPKYDSQVVAHHTIKFCCERVQRTPSIADFPYLQFRPNHGKILMRDGISPLDQLVQRLFAFFIA